MLSALNAHYPNMKFEVYPDPNGVDKIVILGFLPFPYQVVVSRVNYDPQPGRITIDWPQGVLMNSVDANRFGDAIVRAVAIANDFDYYLRHYAS